MSSKLPITITVSIYYRADECLPLVLKSILLDDVDPNSIEVIVCDDCCPTPENVIADIIAKFLPFFGRITHIRNPAHAGFRKSFLLKEALELSNSDVFVFLDGDCVIHSKALGRLTSGALLQDALCQGQRVFLTNQSISWGIENIDSITDFKILRDKFYVDNTKTRKNKKRYRDILKLQAQGTPGRFNYASGYFMALKTPLAKEIGVNTHAIRGYMEDTDFAKRLFEEKGIDVFEVRDTEVLHLFEHH